MFIAICPDCEKHETLHAFPISPYSWPQCDDCCQSMNVYEKAPALPTQETEEG